MSLDIYLNRPKCPTCGCGNDAIWSRNITHNLVPMAKDAGIYFVMWRPEEINVTVASQAIPLLEYGISCLKQYPDRYKLMNPSNGWGDYDTLVDVASEYLSACRTWPDAIIEVSR